MKYDNLRIDTLKLSVKIIVPKTAMDMLAEGRTIAAVRKQPHYVRSWLIKGYGSPTTGHSYILSRKGIVLMISNSLAKGMIVQLGSVQSHRVNNQLPKLLIKICQSLGLRMVDYKITRLDLKRDYDVEINDYKDILIDPDNRVGAANLWAGAWWKGKKLTGCQYGKGIKVLRIYNKIEEMKAKDEFIKRNIIEGGTKGFKNITRVEYQLRGDALKQLQIGKILTIKKLREIWNRMSFWIVFVNDDSEWKKSRNYNRYNILINNLTIFNSRYKKNINAEIHPIKKEVDNSQLLAQGLGCLATFFCRTGDVYDIYELRFKLNKWIKTYTERNEKTLNDRMENETGGKKTLQQKISFANCMEC